MIYLTVYKIPRHLSCLIFDIDGTLYTSSAYVFEQVDAQIRHFAHIHGMTEEEARNKITSWRREWSRTHGGKKISLGNTFTAFGVSIQTSIEWRNTILEPEKFLHVDKKMQETISLLAKKYKLVCVTNNPVTAAKRTLRAIGLEELLPNVVGLDTCMKSKPNKDVLRYAAKMMGVPFKECLSVGDRYDIDLALPLELGMGAILVGGAEEVYALPDLLSCNV